MTTKNGYKRIMLKISGEVISDDNGKGIEAGALNKIAEEIVEISKNGFELVIVIGGGNIWRYRDTKEAGIERTTSDYMGMMATIMNAVALKSAIIKAGTDCRVLTSLNIPQLADLYISRKAIKHLEKGRIVISGGGTGNPFFTTDSAAALRAAELNCDVLLKATKVDGVYTSDPMKNKDAKKYETLSYNQAIEENLQVMDQSAFSLCKDNNMKIIVFNMNQKGSILKAAKGEKIGTLIS